MYSSRISTIFCLKPSSDTVGWSDFVAESEVSPYSTSHGDSDRGLSLGLSLGLSRGLSLGLSLRRTSDDPTFLLQTKPVKALYQVSLKATKLLAPFGNKAPFYNYYYRDKHYHIYEKQ